MYGKMTNEILSETKFHELTKEKNYDRFIRPNATNGPVFTDVQLEVGYLGEIDSKAMTFEIHLTLRHWWQDERLKFDPMRGKSVVGLSTLRNLIWTPTLFFLNEKDSEMVKTTEDNVYVKVDSNGKTYMAIRSKVWKWVKCGELYNWVGCEKLYGQGEYGRPHPTHLYSLPYSPWPYSFSHPTHLYRKLYGQGEYGRLYKWVGCRELYQWIECGKLYNWVGFQVDICSLIGKYDIKSLLLRWRQVNQKDLCLIIPELTLPEHSLDKDSVICTENNKNYDTAGGYSGLIATFSLRREFSYYMIEVYVPIMLLVIVSWISFWLDVHAVPARVALGITTILTVITNSRGVKDSIPRVSYIKAVDVWNLGCTLLVFCAFLEFPLVNFIARKARMKAVTEIAQNGDNKGQLQKDVDLNRTFQLVHHRNSAGRLSKLNKTCPIHKNTLKVQDVTDMTEDDGTDDHDGDDSINFSRMLPVASEELARSIDRICRFLFPSIFLLFNIIYWVTWVQH
ncbi:glutamate-gated chloride channel-like [Limulus polyphemus]|uniref:Glutamate-gated chloride channel-like n=1 Tax=Limulus polyphemus TaxID=6850 RepID=A0ABM1SAE8_LIMPO|nr:glutamate-gated chloride channel-like [Limulus polyphemus]